MDRDEILARLRERILAFAASRTGRDLAEDLTQDVLVVLENKYRDVTAPEELLPLALQILRFRMASERRKSERRGEKTAVPPEDLQLAAPGQSPEAWAERQETLQRLTSAIARTGTRCREIFRLKLLGRSFTEIQEQLGAASVNTVYTWDARCRQRLMELMGGRWESK
jgi:RNA polymerase sigma-70 factor, ECF subfamily